MVETPPLRLMFETLNRERRDGLMETPYEGVPATLTHDKVFHAIEELLRDQDLAGLRFATQPRREVGHCPDDAVIPSTFESDGSNRRVPRRHPDPAIQVVPATCPFVAKSRHGIA